MQKNIFSNMMRDAFLLYPEMLCNMVIPAQEQESLIRNLLASEGFDHRAVWENVLFSPYESILIFS